MRRRVAAVVAGWVAIPFLVPLLPKDSLTDGTIAVAGALLLFVIPDGSGRALITLARDKDGSLSMLRRDIAGAGTARGTLRKRSE